MKIIFIILLTFFSSILYAEDINFAENTEIDLGLNSESNLVPKVNLPIYWNSNIYSALGINVFHTSETSDIDGTPGSRQLYEATETVYNFTPIGYRQTFSAANVYLGLVYTYRDAESSEFGYMNMPTSLGGELVALENNIDYNLHSISAEFAIEYKDDFMLINLSGRISPWQYLDLSQDTVAKPIVQTNADMNTTTSMTELSYNIAGSAAFKLHRFIGVRINASYNFMPIEYDLDMLDYDGTFHFSKGNVSEEETLLSYGLQLFIPTLNIAGLSPSIGYEERKYDVNNKTTMGDISEEDKSSYTEHIVSLGLVYNW
ncbi:MAG: hypothetical protein LBV09_03420 [Deferribacteraceae bacterium]|jgi:hypothetical protein|nr:hypothetical protein [Deferribacteraceae bacterium]